jgi:hypothetical protein
MTEETVYNHKAEIGVVAGIAAAYSMMGFGINRLSK